MIGRTETLRSLNFSEVFCTWNLSWQYTTPIGTLRTHSHASSHVVFDTAPIQSPSNVFVRWLNGLGADYNLATTALLTLMSQILGESLGLCTHQLTHSCFKGTDMVIIIAISIIDLKFELLDLFEPVSHLERSGEVRVLIVRDLLRWTNLDPLVLTHLVDVTNWVRLTHDI